MKRTIIKRVCLVDSNGNRREFSKDYIGTLPDSAILDALYTKYDNVWIGSNLYKVFRDGNGFISYWRYEVYEVLQCEKSRFDLWLDAVRRI